MVLNVAGVIYIQITVFDIGEVNQTNFAKKVRITSAGSPWFLNSSVTVRICVIAFLHENPMCENVTIGYRHFR